MSTLNVRYARTLFVERDDRYRVQSVERALELLGTLADAGAEGMTLSDLGRSLEVSKSSAYAILQTMLAHGFVADSGEGMGRRYRLGMALARLGDAVTSQIALRDVAVPVLRSLTAATGLTSRVAVFDEPHAVVIGSIDAANSAIQFASNLFKRELMHSSAVGKSMLATLDEQHVRALLRQAGHAAQDRAHDHRRRRDAARARGGRPRRATRSTTRRTSTASSASPPSCSTTREAAPARSA